MKSKGTRWTDAIAILPLVIGVSCLLLGIMMHLFIIPFIVDSNIRQNSQLVPDSRLLAKWTHPEYKMQFKVFVFSVRNPDEFMAGEKPIVKESGPYVFDKKMENQVQSAANGTVKYRRFANYTFNDADSCVSCILGNRVWVPNLIFQKFVEAASTQGMKAAATTLLSQTAFLEVEVGELLFEGYKDPFLDKVCDIPFMDFVCESLLDLPERIGLFYEYNNTHDGDFEIKDGTDDVNELGKIVSWNGQTTMDETWWTNEESRTIRGTEGSLFPPFIKKHEKLWVFVSQLCRSIWLEFDKEIEYKGLTAYRFIMPPEVLDPSLEQNKGYCNPTEKKFFDSQNDTDCWPKGLLEISRCQRGNPPIMISMPNFNFAADEVRQSVKGMNETDAERDIITVDIEPRLGAVLRASRRFQVNIEMWKGVDLSFPVNLKKMKSSIIPVLIVHEEVEADDDTIAAITNELYNTEWYAYLAGKLIALFGVLVLIFTAIYLVVRMNLCKRLLGGKDHSVSPLPDYRPRHQLEKNM